MRTSALMWYLRYHNPKWPVASYAHPEAGDRSRGARIHWRDPGGGHWSRPKNRGGEGEWDEDGGRGKGGDGS